MWGILLLSFVLSCGADYRPTLQSDDILSTAMSRVEHLLRNDELECLPRLLCEYAAGGNPGQGRAINVDLNSLFTLLQYIGLDQSNNKASPMLNFAKAATLGLSNRGDSYGCYRSYPRCPRDQGRLLHYLNNHRGGFFRGFGGYYHRTKEEDFKNVKPATSESRIVNSKNPSNFNYRYPPYNSPGTSNLNNVRYPQLENNFPYSEKPEFVFSNNHRNPKLLASAQGTDRLPNRLNFSPTYESGSSLAFPNGYNDIASNFFPQL